MYTPFELQISARFDDALAILADTCVEPATVLAGGTNVIVDLRAKRIHPKRIVSIDRLQELRGISIEDSRIIVGSRTTVSDLLRSKDVASAAPALVESARVFAGQMVRNAATIGGNIACGSPAADLVPVLLSVDAEVTLVSRGGERTVALDDYFLGYKRSVRRPDELISRISWKRLPAGAANIFYKLGRRKGDAITVTGVAVTLDVAEGRCSRARIALGAVAPTVIRAKKAEAMLESHKITSELIEAAANQAVAECSPIDDVRASAGYRRHTVRVLVRRLLNQAWSHFA